MAHYGKFVGAVSEDGDTADQGDGDRDRVGQEHHEDAAETDGAEGVHCIPGRDEGKRILSVIEAGRGGGVRDEQLLNRIYNGSLGLMVNTLVKKQDIPDEEMEELYRIIQEARAEKKEKGEA